jgi:uncharacterized protein (TIGR02391 family)
MAVRHITERTRERIERLVDLLYDFLPLSAYRDEATTFTSIFAESRKEHYLEGKNKTEALQNGWEELIRHHPRLPKKFVRKIVPAAKEYRDYKGDPLSREELDELADVLEELGFDMREELEAVEVDVQVRQETVPKEDLVERLDHHPLHNALATEPLELFRDGHFNESVRKAAERFEAEVRHRSQLGRSGRDLMAQAFKFDGGAIQLSGVEVEAENRESFQEGFKFLTMGMMASIRNVFSHGDEERRSAEECFEMLMFLNWLFGRLDEAETEA